MPSPSEQMRQYYYVKLLLPKLFSPKMEYQNILIDQVVTIDRNKTCEVHDKHSSLTNTVKQNINAGIISKD